MRYHHGDTIIEVMFAFVIFSLVAVGTIMLMNQGVAMAQRSLEITQVREEVDAQVTMAKYMQYHADDASWREFLDKSLSQSVPSFDEVLNNEQTGSKEKCPTSRSLEKAFYFVKSANDSITTTSVNQTNFVDALTYGRVDYDKDQPKSYGLWAHITKAEGDTSTGKTNAYDLHIRACWSSVGTEEPMTIGTVTRLYDVR